MYLETTQRERLLFLQNKNLKTNPDEIINKRNKNFKSKFFFLCVQCIKMSKFKLDYDEDTLRNCIKYFYNLARMEHRNAIFYIWSNCEKLCQNILLVADKYVLTKLRMRRQFGDCNATQGNVGFFRCNVNVKAKKKCFAWAIALDRKRP
jgi:hypothetical protein